MTTASTLSEGTRSASTASRSSAAPIVSAAFGAIARHHDNFGDAGSRSAWIARGVSRRSSSANSSTAMTRPSTATKTVSAERQDARRAARRAHSSSRFFAMDELRASRR